MDTDEDLPTLIRRKDHLNVLRYVRVHALREPALVVEHGQALLGKNLSKKLSDELIRLAVLEQICLAALDNGQPEIAETCLQRFKDAGIDKESTRFRCLLARCLEADGSFDDADKIYDTLLEENPSNLLALKRKYCIRKAQPDKQVEAMEALNAYLEQNYCDPAAWYEMAQARMKMGDYKAAAFALEELVLIVPLDSDIHCELAECYATIGGLDNLMLARKHMAQALELDGSNKRAQYGLAVVADAYITEASNKKNQNEYEIEVAKELIKYASEQLVLSYKGCKMYSAIKGMMSEYTETE